MHRREVLALFGALAGSSPMFAAYSRHTINPIGLQLYTVREALERNFEATLARVAAIGYREVEFAGYFGRSASEVRSSLRQTGLMAPSAHVSLEALGSSWGSVIENALAIGHRYLVVAAANAVADIDGYRRIAERFNRAGEVAAKAGIRLGYHNHAFEFTPLGGELPYDVLIEATDPKYVCFEMDVFWITQGGQNALAYLARWPGRIALLHLKDAAGTRPYRMAAVGAGVIDWRRILAEGTRSGVKHCFVEHDDAVDPYASIAASYAYLRALRF